MKKVQASCRIRFFNSVSIQPIFRNFLAEEIAKDRPYQHNRTQQKQFFLRGVPYGFQDVCCDEKLKPEDNFVCKLFSYLLVAIRSLQNFKQDNL